VLESQVFGGSPLLQQGELDFSPAKDALQQEWALALGIQLNELDEMSKTKEPAE
jgi:hypothetical protein